MLVYTEYILPDLYVSVYIISTVLQSCHKITYCSIEMNSGRKTSDDKRLTKLMYR